ncbi:MAG: hypothetical protein WC897_01300 [Candidatus Gracilibacteria bacterium]
MQFIKDAKFKVEFSAYAETHFCKKFYKRYKEKKWIATRNTIEETLERAQEVEKTTLISVIKFHSEDDAGIFKLDFRIAGTNQSPHSSGNRAIFLLSNNLETVKILLVYGKEDLPKNQQETAWILDQIKQNFPEYKKYCK